MAMDLRDRRSLREVGDFQIHVSLSIWKGWYRLVPGSSSAQKGLNSFKKRSFHEQCDIRSDRKSCQDVTSRSFDERLK